MSEWLNHYRRSTESFRATEFAEVRRMLVGFVEEVDKTPDSCPDFVRSADSALSFLESAELSGNPVTFLLGFNALKTVLKIHVPTEIHTRACMDLQNTIKMQHGSL